MCLSIARVMLIIINGIFLVIGAILLGVGIWVVVDTNSLISLISKIGDTGGTNVGGLLSSAAYIIIAFGGFVFILGFFGFFGACKEIQSFLVIYAILVILVILAEIAAIILAAVYYNTMIAKGTALFVTAIGTNYVGQWNTSDALSLAIDGIQIGLHCCGVYNSTDFSSAKNWNRSYQERENGPIVQATLPFTCCPYTDTRAFPAGQPRTGMTDTSCPYNPIANSYKDTGCYDKLLYYIHAYSKAVIIAVSVIAFVELFAVAFACMMRSNISKSNMSV